MSTFTEVIYIDESSDCGLSVASRKKRPYFSLGYVYCRDPITLRKKLQRQLRRQHRRNRYPPELKEIKFYLPITKIKSDWGYSDREIRRYKKYLPQFRRKAIDIILNSSCGIYSAILKKDTIKKPTWTSERLGNYIFAQTLFQRILNILQTGKPPTIIFDKGRLSIAKTTDFKLYLTNKERYSDYIGTKKYQGSIGTPVDMSSLSEPGLWAADIVAGSFYHKYSSLDRTYADLLTPSYIGVGERRFWNFTY